MLAAVETISGSVDISSSHLILDILELFVSMSMSDSSILKCLDLWLDRFCSGQGLVLQGLQFLSKSAARVEDTERRRITAEDSAVQMSMPQTQSLLAWIESDA